MRIDDIGKMIILPEQYTDANQYPSNYKHNSSQRLENNLKINVEDQAQWCIILVLPYVTQRRANLFEFKAILVYRMSFRSIRVT